jgi:hypothetical protein
MVFVLSEGGLALMRIGLRDILAFKGLDNTFRQHIFMSIFAAAAAAATAFDAGLAKRSICAKTRQRQGSVQGLRRR